MVTIATELAPVLNDLLNMFLKGQKEGGSFRDTVLKLAQDGSIQEWFRTVVLWADCDSKRVPLTAAERKACADDETRAALAATKPLYGPVPRVVSLVSNASRSPAGQGPTWSYTTTKPADDWSKPGFRPTRIVTPTFRLLGSGSPLVALWLPVWRTLPVSRSSSASP